MRNYKKQIVNLLKLADYLGGEANRRANTIADHNGPVPKEFRYKDHGRADVYRTIVFYILRPELLEKLDYDKVFDRKTTLPYWLRTAKRKKKQ